MWEFFRDLLDIFKESNAKGKIALFFIIVLASILGASIIGVGWLYKYNIGTTEIIKRVNDANHPPTNKEEDLKEISKMLGEIGMNLHGLKNDIDTKITYDNLSIRCGINNGELDDWEVSVSGKNTLNLSEGNEILLVNTTSSHTPSAKYIVKFVRKSDKENDKYKAELYINKAAAKYLLIDNAEDRGEFDLKVQRIR